ncbi:MAG: NAD(P)-dependent dehydrogenase (short-subunit alcohol dehydrogenase family) [bacterium]|jgi:NAD(P)-dependent dehydrogenase (short-subunit alcohol dehydrogenase family)
MTQRSVLITGCSSGIGLDAARTLSSRGWHVLATCRKESDCELLRAEGLESFPLDYDDSQSISQGVLHALELTNGKLDALFNNGAYAIPGLVEDLPRGALRAIFETNLFGQFELINGVLPIMRKQGHGRIVNCSSVLGFAAQPFRGAYNASKFAMEGLSDTLRLELSDSPIQVILIEPGPIKTLIRQNSIAPFERWVNWKSSHQRERYENELCPRLYTPANIKNKFELLPDAVTEKLIHALESTRPRPRYFVTTPTYLAGFFKRVLSTRWFDRVLSR